MNALHTQSYPLLPVCGHSMYVCSCMLVAWHRLCCRSTSARHVNEALTRPNSTKDGTEPRMKGSKRERRTAPRATATTGDGTKRVYARPQACNYIRTCCGHTLAREGSFGYAMHSYTRCNHATPRISKHHYSHSSCNYNQCYN